MESRLLQCSGNAVSYSTLYVKRAWQLQELTQDVAST